MSLKFKLIFLPFLVLITGFILIYSLFDWLVFIWPGYLQDNGVLEIGVAIFLIWLPAKFILWPRLKLLDLPRDTPRSVGPDLYFVLAVVLILAPTFFAQKYLIIRSAKLTPLQNVQLIKKSDRSQYYKVKGWCVDTELIGTSFELTKDKHNPDDLNFYLCMVAPFITNPKTNNEFAEKWLGRVYYRQISNLLTEGEKKEEIEKLKRVAYDDFKRQSATEISYMEQLGNNIDRTQYLKAINEVSDVKDPVIIKGETENFENRNEGNWVLVVSTYLLALLIWYGNLYLVKLKEDAVLLNS